MSKLDLRRYKGHTEGDWYWVSGGIDSTNTNGPSCGAVLESDVMCGTWCLGGSTVLRLSEPDKALMLDAPAILAKLREAVGLLQGFDEMIKGGLGSEWDDQRRAFLATIETGEGGGG